MATSSNRKGNSSNSSKTPSKSSFLTGRVAQLLVLLLAIVFVSPFCWRNGNADAVVQSDWEGQILGQVKSYRQQRQQNSPVSTERPLEGVTLLITGATSGIGKGLTLWTLEKGATVIAMGRSPTKLNDLATEAKQQRLDETETKPQKLFTVIADFADLSSVSKAVDQMKEYSNDDDASNSFPSHIDIVVCNAGIHTGFSTLWDPHQPTAQGYDLTFGVNYLSHFLLTEKLIEKTTLLSPPKNKRHSKIVHVTSSFHFAVDGSDLWPGKDWANDKNNKDNDPVAAQLGGNHGFTFFRSQRQYANSKLAQILHARYYNNHYNDTIQSVTACPAWVGTGIIQAHHESIPARLFRYLAFSAHGYGLSSVLAAMFASDTTENGDEEYGDFFISTKMMQGGSHVDELFSPKLSSSYGDDSNGDPLKTTTTLSWQQKIFYHWTPIRDAVFFGGAMVILQWQRLFPTVVETAQSSQASYNLNLQEEFYHWSRNAVQEWM